MREISLNIMDLAQNSVKANATLIEITVVSSIKDNIIEFTIADNGCGMTETELNQVIDPFFTSRTSRRVGLGIPFCKLACDQADGKFEITSNKNIGTTLKASFKYDHIDRQPMGDLASAILFTSTADNEIDVVFKYNADEIDFIFDTREVKAVLEGVPLNTPEVFEYLKEMLNEGINTNK